MLNTIGFATLMMTIMVNAVAVLTAMKLPRREQLLAAAVAGAWVGIAAALAAAGALGFAPAQPVPVIGLLAGGPLVLAAGFWLGSANFRAIVTALPLPLLVGLHAMRLLGALFLALAAVGRLSGPFPYFAGLGDVLTGALAIPLALRLAQGEQTPIGWWNLLGAVDLLLAVTLGITSAQGSPLQLFHGGAGSEAMQHLPFSLVPTVLVPYYLITHGIIAAKITSRANAQTLAIA